MTGGLNGSLVGGTTYVSGGAPVLGTGATVIRRSRVAGVVGGATTVLSPPVYGGLAGVVGGPVYGGATTVVGGGQLVGGTTVVGGSQLVGGTVIGGTGIRSSRLVGGAAYGTPVGTTTTTYTTGVPTVVGGAVHHY